jgi:hypothetical protein
MPIDHIDDWEMRLARQNAFWDCAVIDRPVVVMTTPAPDAGPPPPPRPHADDRARWWDTQRVVEQAVHGARSTRYHGDALPLACPNLGPEVFSAWFGIDLEYTDRTAYAIPVIESWDDAGKLEFSEENLYWRKMLELTDALLQAGRGLYYVGLTDLHPGGDAIAAFRDPQDLNLDLLMHPEEVKALLNRTYDIYYKVMDFWFDTLLDQHGQAACCWAGIVSERRWYVPSNDFSCMVSPEMFREFFLPGIVEECRYLEASMYHLDGPGALHHLDDLLAIDELNAVQWVYGSGNGRATDWLHIYRRIQEAGKGMQLTIAPGELDTITEALRPEGVWLRVGVRNEDDAAEVLRRVERWT